MSMQEKKVLTSVKVDKELFEEFKIDNIRRKFTLQKLVERSMYLYMTDEDFRRQVTNQVTVSLNDKDKEQL